MARSASVSWFDGSVEHVRVFTISENTISERCWDGEGWNTGSYSAEGDAVAAAVFTKPDGQACLMVFHTEGSRTREWYWDGEGWQEGQFEAEGSVESATAWVDANGEHHTRVYVRDPDGNLAEICWDPSDGWHTGPIFLVDLWAAAAGSPGGQDGRVERVVDGPPRSRCKNLYPSRGWSETNALDLAGRLASRCQRNPWDSRTARCLYPMSSTRG